MWLALAGVGCGDPPQAGGLAVPPANDASAASTADAFSHDGSLPATDGAGAGSHDDGATLAEGGPGTGDDATTPLDATSSQPGVWRALVGKPAPPDNPLKGFLPYRGTYAFPHSMEWFYLPLNVLMTGPSAFTFDAGLEPLLADVASRGHQAVFRVYLDYPTLPTGVPQFLLSAGLVMRPYTDYGGGQSPDYENPSLVAALEAFVAALGARYDGDPRVGFLTEGLLGFWGEWHTYPHDTWFASTATQNRVLSAFDRAFSSTKLLVRKPVGNSATLRVGYHDDSFAYETLAPTSYNFWPLILSAGLADIWKTQAIGGELRPEIQSSVFDAPPVSPDDYATCVATTHASWLLNQTAFDPSFTGGKHDRALAGSAMLGYALAVTSARVGVSPGSFVQLDVEVVNGGVAPFYYDWPVDVAVLRGDTVVQLWHPAWKLSSLLPGVARTLSTQSTVPGLGTAPFTVGIRVPNPLPQGPALRFGNAEQESTWLRVGP
jgi:hypothetical protein